MYDLLQPGFIEGSKSVLDIVDLVLVRIYPDDGMIQAGETGSGDATHIAEPENGNSGPVI